MKKCTIKQCERTYYGKGLCAMHYQRRRTGIDIDKPVQIRGDDRQRFESKISKTKGCWVWLGAKRNSKGYGCFTFNGKTCAAHRVAYELFVGVIPKGKQLDHTCNNRACVNPSHLEPVSNKENQYRGYERRGYWPIEGREKHKKLCAFCDVEIEAIMEWKKYCSNSCKCKSQRERWATV